MLLFLLQTCSHSQRVRLNINWDACSKVHGELGMRTAVILMGILCLISFPACRKVIVRGSTQLLPDTFPPPPLCLEGKKKSTAPFSSLSCIPQYWAPEPGMCSFNGRVQKNASPYGPAALTDSIQKSLSLADFIYLIFYRNFPSTQKTGVLCNTCSKIISLEWKHH